MHFKKIYIELSDICGLQCSFCPNQKAVRGLMSQELFAKIVRQIRGKCHRVCLHILGDPCRIKNLKEYLDILRQNDLSVDLVTSGFYLKDKESLLHPAIHQIAFSLDAGFDKNNPTKEGYLQDILEFCDFKRKQQNKIFINLRVQDTTLKRIPLQQIFDFFKKTIPNDFKTFERIKLDEYIFLNITKTFIWADLKMQNICHTKKCHALKEQIGILSNGIVVPCCIDTQGEIALGNVNKQSLDEILSSKRAIAIKKGFEQNIAIEELCKRCHFPTTRSSN
ncbi:radical SAM/SPASM domain-containing protein [Helicobacter anseris]|nr:radical SAM/SPASM domain-containing protein [Helicobacter anseris]